MNSDPDDPNDVNKTPPKILKRSGKQFNNNWMQINEFKPWLQPDITDSFKARCLACNVSIK